MARAPIADGLFTWPSDDPRLLGSRCAGCRTVTFPAQGTCPRCYRDEMETIELPSRGTLWTWTTQAFRPKSADEGGLYLGPEPFEPFTLGYVELPGHCKVETRLTEPDGSNLSIGMEMELTLVPFRVDEHGNEVVTFAFRPAP